MKASELRIGNLCRQITHSSNKIVRVDKTDFEDIEKEEIDLFPIPLTEEWLLKFGFTKGTITQFKGCYFNIWYEKYVIQRMQNKWTLFIDCDTHLELLTGFVYVHQLQNLYFALTGEELEIND